MFQVNGFWLPDGETHLISFLQNGPEFAGGPTYQLHKFIAALPFVKNFGHGVDIGAHCGLWSRPMAAVFGKVTAFEPVAEHTQCWYMNVTAENAYLHQIALGASHGAVRLTTGKSSSGDTYVKDDGEHLAEMHTLDSIALTKVDFMKIDCEGFENFIITGGERTIKRDKPVMIVEQKHGKGSTFGIHDTLAVRTLTSWGAEVVTVIAGDYILKWR